MSADPDRLDGAPGEGSGTPARVATGVGLRLAEAREARGLAVSEIAARLRLHPRQVAALESERWDALPEAPFVRGFVRNYAKELQLDPLPLLTALDDRLPAPRPTTSLPASEGIAAHAHRQRLERASRTAVIGGVIVALVLLGVIGWIASQRAAPAPTPTNAPATTGLTEPGGQTPAGSATTAAAPAPAAPASGASIAPAPSTAAALNAASGGEAKPGQAQASAPAAVAAGSPLRLVVGERPSWVEITQADGRIVLVGLQEPGTDRRLGGAQAPLHLVIGNASSVTLEYRGKRVDLAPHIRANDLARLTLE